MLVIGIVGLSIIYLLQTGNIFEQHRSELQHTATAIAANVDPVLHESLSEPDQMDSAAYVAIADYFRKAKSGNPLIDDIYTLRPTGTPHTYAFVVSIDETNDDNKNGVIDEDEQRPGLGELYKTSNYPDLEKGFEGSSADERITYDKWGAWLSGYAPIRDEHGKAVAIVGVDYPAASVTAHRREYYRVLRTGFIIMLPVAVLVAWFVSWRLSLPMQILAEGMDRVAHGDLRYRLPIKGNREEQIFSQLFNNMLNLYNPSVRPRQPGVEENQHTEET